MEFFGGYSVPPKFFQTILQAIGVQSARDLHGIFTVVVEGARSWQLRIGITQNARNAIARERSVFAVSKHASASRFVGHGVRAQLCSVRGY